MNSNTQYTEYGKISALFSQDTLANLCLDKIGVQTGPFGSQLHNEDYVLAGTPIITVEHLGDNRITYQNMPLVSDEDKARLSKYCIKEGDIVFSRVGSVDRRALVRQEEDGWLFSGRCLRVRVDKTQIDPVYLSYFFGLDGFKNYIKSIAVGATMPSINTKILSNLPIYYPNLETQSKIGQILQKLDDKIALNTQINQTLESMAQAIFKSWFVDFEPVKAKIAAIEAGEDIGSVNRAAMRAISGKSNDELDKMQTEQPDDYAQLEGTAKLFPAAMWDSELGEVPEGWEVSIIGDEVKVVGGGTPSTKNPDFWEGGEIHWTTPKDLSNLTDKVLLTTERKITEAGLKKVSSGLLPVNTVLMSSRAPVGYLALAKVPVAVNQGYIAMICQQRLSPEYIIQWCNSEMNDIKQRSSGTTFAEISKKNFRIIPVLVPSEEVQQSYSKLVSGLYDEITKIAMESSSLVGIRDTLLPKLLSGELSVEKIELNRADI